MRKKQFSSADFAETLAQLSAYLPEKLVHRSVEKDDVHQQFSDERKHPVHIVNLPSNSISMTIGGLLLGCRKVFF